MDHEMNRDRRSEERTVPPAALHATLRPGCAVTLVDVSGVGALVEAPRAMRPGARVQLLVATARERHAITAHILRCMVWSLHPVEGVTYRAAIRFDARVDWSWAAPTLRGNELPERAEAGGANSGKLVPGPIPLVFATAGNAAK